MTDWTDSLILTLPTGRTLDEERRLWGGTLPGEEVVQSERPVGPHSGATGVRLGRPRGVPVAS